MKRTKILVVDDEPRIRQAMRGALLAHGYNVLEAGDGEQALAVFWNESPELVLLDVNMPVVDGFEVCREIRCASRVPIIMLTVRSSEADKVQALDSGADGYVMKPFGFPELLARIRSALRRASKDVNEAVLFSKNLTINFERRSVTVRRQQIHLTPKEFEVLRELVVNGGKPISHRRLLHVVWGPGHSDDIECLRVVINQLREKIELDPARPEYIQTEPFIGYRFALPPEARFEHLNVFSTVES